MNIQQLNYFITVAEIGQITEAAQKLYIAQPALSRSLQRLELELGVTLFTRTKSGMELTDTGRVLYEKGIWLLRNYRDMLSAIHEAEEGVQGTIRIGTGYTTIPLMSDKIIAMRSKYPAVEFRITQTDPNELIELLKKDKMDLIFLPRPLEGGPFSTIALEPDPLVLAVNPELDPCPSEEEVPIEKLENIPLCLLRLGDYYGYNEVLFAECQRKGVSPRVLCQSNTASASIMLVTQGLGLSYQPKSVVDALANECLYGKRIKGFEHFTYPVILYNQNAYISKATRVFLMQFQSMCPIPEELQTTIDMGTTATNFDRNRHDASPVKSPRDEDTHG